MNTQQNEIDVLKAQVKTLDAALSKQSRKTKGMFYGFGCLLFAGITVAATSMQGVPDLIQAKKFEVVNDEGKAVVVLRSDSYGGELRIAEKSGKPTVGINPGEFKMNSNDGNPALLFLAAKHGGDISLFNKDMKMVVGLGTGGGGGKLGIYNKDGKTVFSKP